MAAVHLHLLCHFPTFDPANGRVAAPPIRDYHWVMEYVCDAPGGKTWFRIETEAEAQFESQEMNHAVEKYFRREKERAGQTYRPTSASFIERDIGLAAHLKLEMPIFLTLRNSEGSALATAMLPPRGEDNAGFRIIIVGRDNGDPYPAEADAIAALGRHFGLELPRARCFPYGR
ncbi:MAG TPA: hypothetical protein VGG69_10685 [Rhizomicrobium sp.]|jgi:hypothetical protein